METSNIPVADRVRPAHDILQSTANDAGVHGLHIWGSALHRDPPQRSTEGVGPAPTDIADDVARCLAQSAGLGLPEDR